MFFDTYKRLCAERKKSPSAVAEELGINKSNVSNWKKEGYTPRGDALQRIAEYFGVSVDYLLSEIPTVSGWEPDYWEDWQNAKNDEEKKNILTSHGIPPELASQANDLFRQKNPAKMAGINEDELKFALFGTTDIDDQTFADVKAYAEFKRDQQKR